MVPKESFYHSDTNLYHVGYYWTLGCQYAQTHGGWEYIQMNYPKYKFIFCSLTYAGFWFII